MSVKSERGVTVECEFPDCDEHGKVWEFQSGYCSERCKKKHKGRKALGKWKFSHTRCFTCLTRLKEIEPPKPDEAFDEEGTGWTWDPEEEYWTLEKYTQKESCEAAVGFQHRTPEAGTGEKDIKDLVATGTICDHCGNTDHTAHVSYLVSTDRVVNRIVAYLRREENDHTVDADQLRSTYVETDDLELAAGSALDD